MAGVCHSTHVGKHTGKHNFKECLLPEEKKICAHEKVGDQCQVTWNQELELDAEVFEPGKKSLEPAGTDQSLP